MKNTLSRMLGVASMLALLAATAATQAAAASPVVYPSKGQSAKQQDQDRYECHDWARGQSGFDPTQAASVTPTAVATTTPSTATAALANAGSSSAGTLAAGAMGGAAVAELTHHDAGRGAAVGALGNVLRQRVKQQQDQTKAQQQQQQSAQAQQSQQQQAAAAQSRERQRSTYDRAFAACLEGRGYTVK